MNQHSSILIFSIIASLLTFCVTRAVWRERFPVGPTGLLAACVAGLAFLGLSQTAEGWVGFLLLPYAALALTLLLLFIFALLKRGLGRLDRRDGRRGADRIAEARRNGEADRRTNRSPFERPVRPRSERQTKSASSPDTGGAKQCGESFARQRQRSSSDSHRFRQ